MQRLERHEHGWRAIFGLQTCYRDARDYPSRGLRLSCIIKDAPSGLELRETYAVLKSEVPL